MNKELLNKQNEIRKKLSDFIEQNSVYEENTENDSLNDLMSRNMGQMKTFKLETIEDVIYYKSLIDEDKEISRQISLEYQNYKLLQDRKDKINNIRNNEK